VYDQYSALRPGDLVRLYDSSYYKAPMINYTTHAETIRWTLDTNDDGLVDRRDTNDNVEERETAWNPNDMVFIREINGENDQQVTLSVLGPFDAKDQRTNLTPLFQYWLLDPDQVFSLLGDSNNDGRLDGDEKYFRSITSQQILQSVRRIQITITTESDRTDPFNRKQHRRVSLSSEVSLRDAEK